MADAFLSFALRKLGDFLSQQVSLLTSLRDEITWLRNELLFIQPFLKDAELKQCADHRVVQWVFEINSIANDAVAILETYSFEAGKRASYLKACACICRKEKKFYNVAKEIKSLKKRIMDISRKRETYGITNINSNAGEGPSNQVATLRRTTSYVDDHDYIFVGFQDVVQNLLAELLKAEPRRSVLSIYGMGGLGKTTLARKLYTSPNIASSFPTRSWICVSQEKLLDVGAMVPEMESLAKDMVEKCRGLPLAIVVLSGLLSHKKGLNEWQKCFLYFGIFPEDQVLEADNIIRLWMEDVAEGFLNELIRRSLVQVAKTLWEKVTDCRVHDLLRDLAIQKALEVNFFDFYDPRKHSISSLCIRHVIHSEGERYLSLDLSNLKLRSIMFSDPDFHNMSLMKFSSVFQHLYVLYLDMRAVSIIPDAIGSLYHLKLLILRGIRDVPSSIGNLKNLQTLVVNEGEYSCELPT
ncbi:putative disease resistance RPP13-like protein 3 [Solanum tuberosum]|uniref:putative disease resistance RPP13-like protein 3 n=1 Tax=Solanum tuberosum TaxID=4113 RepID=UPI00073A3AA2|nr:PREDICTED: putative disease resistance RPP13-like protein 3 [Solanum tuberosum]